MNIKEAMDLLLYQGTMRQTEIEGEPVTLTYEEFQATKVLYGYVSDLKAAQRFLQETELLKK